MPVSTFIAIIIIVVAVILFVAVEIYRRRKVKQNHVKTKYSIFPLIGKKFIWLSNNIKKTQGQKTTIYFDLTVEV